MEKIIEDTETVPEYQGEDEENVDHLRDMASEGPVIRLVNLIITRAIELRASDIHFEPFEEQFRVRYRIDGVLHDVESPPKRLQPAVVSRVKIMAKLNIAERRLPQDGRIMLRVKGKEIDFRVSIDSNDSWGEHRLPDFGQEQHRPGHCEPGFPRGHDGGVHRPHPEASRNHSRHRSDGKRKDDHPLLRPGKDQFS